MRSGASVALDSQVTPKGKLSVPPFVRWDKFMDEFVWEQGEHLTTIGPTGSGKTVLNRELLKRRDFVVVLGVKNKDPELYGPFQRMGYKLVHKFEPRPPDEAEEALVLFVPKTDKHGAEARQIKGRKFRQVLNDVYDVGYWCVYADDLQYESDKLGLRTEFEEIWQLGRSEKATVAGSSQEPVDIPVMAYGMATHLFLFGNPDRRRAQRMAELTGIDRERAEYTILALDEHEFLYVNRKTKRMVRSKVLTRRR
jgi:hypothetical protein